MVCDNAAHSGGISAVMLQQASGLRAAGIRVYMFAAFGPADPALLPQTDGVVCMLEAPGQRNRLGEVWNRAAALALQQFLARFSADDTVVHIHALSMGLSPLDCTGLARRKNTVCHHRARCGLGLPHGLFLPFWQGQAVRL